MSCRFRSSTKPHQQMPPFSLFVWPIILCLALFLYAGLPEPSHAISIKRPTLTSLFLDATDIVRAKVQSKQNLKTQGGLPIVKTTFQVERSWKGSSSNVLHIQLLATNTPPYSLHAPQIPQFQVGERVILSLKKTKSTNKHLLVALYYGVFDLVKPKDTWIVKHRGHLLPPCSLEDFEATLQSILSPNHRRSKQINHSTR